LQRTITKARSSGIKKKVTNPNESEDSALRAVRAWIALLAHRNRKRGEIVHSRYVDVQTSRIYPSARRCSALFGCATPAGNTPESTHRRSGANRMQGEGIVMSMEMAAGRFIPSAILERLGSDSPVPMLPAGDCGCTAK